MDWGKKEGANKIREYGTAGASVRKHAALVIQGCHPVQEEERPQYISRNDTNSNRSELIIAGKKLINAYDLLAAFCRGARTI